jgi:hypothetical protein
MLWMIPWIPIAIYDSPAIYRAFQSIYHIFQSIYHDFGSIYPSFRSISGGPLYSPPSIFDVLYAGSLLGSIPGSDLI